MAKAKIKDTGANVPANWDEELARAAEEDSARLVVGTGNKLSVRGKKFTYQGNTLSPMPPIVIVDFVFYNAMFDSAFDPDEMTAPACFALGPVQAELHNHERSPNVQGGKEPNAHVPGGACADCWANKFGTADQGRGKRCGNRVKAAFIDLKGQIPLSYFEVAPTGLSNFNGYGKALAADKLPIFGVATQLKLDEEATYSVIEYIKSDVIRDAKMAARILEARRQARPMLLEPPDVSNYQAPAKGGGKSGGAKAGGAKGTSMPPRRNLKS